MSAVPNPAPGAVGALAKLLQVYPELRALFAGNSATVVAGPTVRDVLTKYVTAVEVKTTTGAVSRTTAWWTRYFCTSFIRMFGDLPVSAARSSHFIDWLAAHPNWRSPHTKNGALRYITG